MLRLSRYTYGAFFTEMAPCVTIGPSRRSGPKDLPLIRELLTDEEYAELLRRMVQVNGPLLDYKQAFGEPGKN